MCYEKRDGASAHTPLYLINNLPNLPCIKQQHWSLLSQTYPLHQEPWQVAYERVP